MTRARIRGGLLVVAGDPSGDVYGSLLIREIRRREPGLRIEAVGGRLMRSAVGPDGGFHCDLASRGITGFVEPARRIPLLVRLLGKLKKVMTGVDAVICIDFYGFNRHVLTAAKRSGVPAYYFISPQVWASRPGRVEHIRRCVERMLVIFPFEEEIYRKARVPVTWVGHPLMDLLPRPQAERGPSRMLRLGLLPGSRAGVSPCS
ncbi:hypothetical protein ACFL2T_05370 [Elusimicrobiota bacterium]